MNHVYSLVWNRTVRALQVASELVHTASGSRVAGSGGSRMRGRRHPLAVACTAALGLAVLAPAAWAAPDSAVIWAPSGPTSPGGDGTWYLFSNVWTDAGQGALAPWTQNGSAWFEGTPGTVRMDNSGGSLKASELRFLVDGYKIAGKGATDAITLVKSANGSGPIIDVGDGSPGSVSDTATISAVLDGEAGFTKTGYGTLVLSGVNTYTGGTVIEGGILELAKSGPLGAGSVTVNGAEGMNSTLKLDSGVTLANDVELRSSETSLDGCATSEACATFDSSGVLNGNRVESTAGYVIVNNHDGGSITATRDAVYLRHGGNVTNSGQGSALITSGLYSIEIGGDTGTVTNEDGATIVGGTAGVRLHVGGTVTNTGAGSTIIGNNTSGTVKGIWIQGGSGTVTNSAGAAISGTHIGVYLLQGGSVTNSGQGSTINLAANPGRVGVIVNGAAGDVTNEDGAGIFGWHGGVFYWKGGTLVNDGQGSLIGLGGPIDAASYGVEVRGKAGTVTNTGGAGIVGGQYGVYLYKGGTITNGAGSSISVTQTTTGDCADTGACAIFGGSASNGSGQGGSLTLVNAGTITGNVQLDSGSANHTTLIAGGTIAGDLDMGTNTGSTLTLDGDAGTAQAYSQAVTGTTALLGTLTKDGAGTWSVDNANLASASGATVKTGTLIVGAETGDGGVVGGAMTVAKTGILGGYGTVGATTVASGGILSPGSSTSLGTAGTFGTFTVDGDLTLQQGSILQLNLGAPDATPGNFGQSDNIQVNGNLELDGATLNVANVGGMGSGLYNVIAYTGTLAQSGDALTIGSGSPFGQALTVQYAPGQVNVLDSSAGPVAVWAPGSATAPGGSGTWDLSTSAWTNVNQDPQGTWTQNGLALFEGTPDTVTVDSSGGAIHAAGLQFFVDGYQVAGATSTDVIMLVNGADGSAPTINVGDGTAGSASSVATISAVLAGTNGLTKTDYGTLVLAGANTYSGGTIVNGGTLEVAAGGALGTGGVTVNGIAGMNSTLKLDSGATLASDVVLRGGATSMVDCTTLQACATFDNAGTLSGNRVESATGFAIVNNHDGGTITDTRDPVYLRHGGTVTNSGQGSALTTSGLYGIEIAGDTGTVTNEDGATVVGGTAGVRLHIGGTVTNTGAGSTIIGNNTSGTVKGVWIQGGSGTVTNSGGAAISGTHIGVYLVVGGSVTNSGQGTMINDAVNPGRLGISVNGTAGDVTNEDGAAIFGWHGGVFYWQGGTVTNDGQGSLISLAGPIDAASYGVEIRGKAGTVTNTGGASIVGGQYGVYLYKGGTITNGAGSSISATQTTTGDCAGTGACAIFGGSADDGSGRGGSLTLVNAGTITGNVQMDPNSANATTLVAGGSIAGDLDMGIDTGSTLTLDGDAGTTQAYSQAVTGTTTFLGALTKNGAGTWSIDNADLASTSGATVTAGTLIVGAAAGDGGAVGGTMMVNETGTLGGYGTVGSTTLAAGATLAPGSSTQPGVAGSFGTFTVNGDLALQSDSVVQLNLGAPDTAPGVLGQDDNIVVNGDLELDGVVLDVADAGGMGTGLYNVISYTGSLAKNGSGLVIGLGVPFGQTLEVQYAPGQVNVAGSSAGPVVIWAPGSSSSPGGAGTWDLSSSTWTNKNQDPQKPWVQNDLAIFKGAPGTVAVDSSAGAIKMAGVQLYSDGYELAGKTAADAITLVKGTNGSTPVIDVGDGTPDSASNSATVSAVLAGVDGLAKTDYGTLVLAGANTFTGGITIRGGTLSVSKDANLGDAGNALTFIGGTTLVNTAPFGTSRDVTMGAGGGVFQTDADLTVSGAISGTGGLVKEGPEALILVGTNTWSGGTTIHAGTLQIGDGGTTGSIKGAIVDNGTLVFNHSNAVTYGGEISGAGQMAQIGTGTLTLNGVSSFVGTTMVQSGTMIVGDEGHRTASLAGSVNVNKGAILAGFGTVGGMDLSGTLSPGNSIGTFHVAGDATFEEGSTFKVEAQPDGKADQLAVDGQLIIKGGEVQITGQMGQWGLATNYTLITASDGVSGQFDKVGIDLVFLQPVLNYAENEVDLVLKRNSISFASIATTTNQRAVATAEDQLGLGNPLYDALVKLDTTTARIAFDKTSGEFYASQQTSRINDSRFVREAINRRLIRGDVDPEAAPISGTGLSAWAHVWGHWGGTFSDLDGNNATLDDNGSGILVGVDRAIDDTARVGFAGGISRNIVSISDRDSRGKLTSGWFGVYGSFAHGPMTFRGGVAYGSDKIPVRRQVRFTGFQEWLSADASGNTMTGYAEGAWTFHMRATDVQPFVNVAYTRVKTDAGNEAGGAAALHVYSSNMGAMFSTMGVRAHGSVARNLDWYGELGWQRAYGNVMPSSTQRFVSGNTPFTVYGVSPPKTAGLGRIGFDWHVTRMIDMEANYEGIFGDHMKDNVARVNVSVQF